MLKQTLNWTPLSRPLLAHLLLGYNCNHHLVIWWLNFQNLTNVEDLPVEDKYSHQHENLYTVNGDYYMESVTYGFTVFMIYFVWVVQRTSMFHKKWI